MNLATVNHIPDAFLASCQSATDPLDSEQDFDFVKYTVPPYTSTLQFINVKRTMTWCVKYINNIKTQEHHLSRQDIICLF